MIGIGQELGQARQTKHSPNRVLEMTDSSTRIALETLDALESRLQRVNWYLSGDNEEGEVLQNVKAEGRDQTVQARLARLENDLGKLSSRSHEFRELLNLCKSAYPTCRLILTWCPRFEIPGSLPVYHIGHAKYPVHC